MTPAQIVEIETPKKVLLNGLWFGPTKPARVFIAVHGLTSSAFSHRRFSSLVSEDTAVLTFSNRGHDAVTRVTRKVGKKGISEFAGAAHEKFEDCADDIDGALRFAQKNGAKEMYLIGHSTGCQKSIYWAFVRKNKGIKGIVLLAPLSDYAGFVKHYPKKKRDAVLALAKKMIKEKRGTELIPSRVWGEESDDAYRFISLYTPDSLEQSIFPYFDESRSVRMYASVTVPVLTFFAGSDEYHDRPPKQLAEWFLKNSGSSRYHGVIIPRVEHGFKGGEAQIASIVREWMMARK